MEKIVQSCHQLISAYKAGLLGACVMPEESAPNFLHTPAECRIAYFTLPMALNYQRDSYKLWQAALLTYNDQDTKAVFDVAAVASMPFELLQKKLGQYKVALQPNKHTLTWQKICQTIDESWGTISAMLQACDNDFLQLRDLVQRKMKRGFPYLSGPKIFNYWSSILSTYAQVPLKNRQYIDIAPDTHVIQCSVRLGVLSQSEADTWTREKISAKWREVLVGSGIDPIDLHAPLWFWSRAGFIYVLPA